ncbi:hypothetical protein JXA84_09510 [candidate division WOR-3 bacterium]|nr:hypothetical protein [candidate division WOR-3 bacterium]
MSQLRKLFGREKKNVDELALNQRLPYNNAIAIEALVNVLSEKGLIDREELLKEVTKLAKQLKEKAPKTSSKN